MAGRRPGRAPKGGRRLPVRFPDDHARLYQEQARKLGLSLSDYIATVVAHAHGLPAPWPSAPASDDQPALDLASAA